MSLHRRLAEVHKELMNTKIEKTGFNKHKGFKYYELEDIIGPITNACYAHEIVLEFCFVEETAILKLVDWNDEKKYIPFRIALPKIITPEKNPNNQLIQTIGANISYLQRYLLKLAFPCLTDKDVIDFDNGTNASSEKQNQKPDKTKSTKAKHKAEKVEDVPVDINVNELIVQAEEALKKKGLSADEITPQAIRMQVLKLKKWNVAEKRVILKFFNEMEAS